MSNKSQAAVSRVERIVAFVAIGIGVVAFLCLLAVLIAPLAGVPGDSMVAPGWQVAFLVAYFGFPIAVALMLALIVTRLIQNRRHRSRP